MQENKSLIFTEAKASDRAQVFALYQSVIGRPLCTWNDNYPGLEEIDMDTDARSLFLLKEGDVLIGAASLNPEQELSDLTCWTETEKPAELSRVVIAPDRQGQGLSGVLVKSFLSVCRDRGITSVRLAVATNNLPAIRTYTRCGFATVGEAFLWGHHFHLCELLL